jgi:uncharacterized iron-regulated protein
MRTSLSLQQSLYRHQQRQIDRIVSGGSAAFRAYERVYKRATRAYSRVIQPSDVRRRVQRSDIVYVGDYHTLALAQSAYLELVDGALATGRPVVLALEFVEQQHQATIDAFLAGRLGEKRFLERIGHPYRGPFDIWPHFAPIFELARKQGLRIHAIDSRGRGAKSLAQRDRSAAKIVAGLAHGDALVMVLMGQFHIAPTHLPAQVTRALKGEPKRQLIAYQNAEGIWWKLAERGLAHRAPAVEVDANSICLINASPVVCQRSFLDYVEAEAGDLPMAEHGIVSAVKLCARHIGTWAGVKVSQQLKALEVVTLKDWAIVERIAKRGKFARHETALLEKHVLSGESAFIPRANTIWLASLSTNHAAEEATHFVRYCAVGDAMARERPRGDEFWSRCLEEALGFFGSKLLNPARQCTSLQQFTQLFSHGTDEQKRTAAFVLAIASAEHDGPEALTGLLPLRNDTLFHAVSHALGYLLGDLLYRGLTNEQLTQADFRRLFADPLDAPLERYFGLKSRLTRHRSRSKAA